MKTDINLADHDDPLLLHTAERLTADTANAREKPSRIFLYVRDDIKCIIQRPTWTSSFLSNQDLTAVVIPARQ